MRTASSLLQGCLKKCHEGYIWEDIANDGSRCRRGLHRGLERGEKKRRLVIGEKSAQGKETNTVTLEESVSACIHCYQDCHFRQGQYSHNRCWVALSRCAITFGRRYMVYYDRRILNALKHRYRSTYINIYISIFKKKRIAESLSCTHYVYDFVCVYACRGYFMYACTF